MIANLDAERTVLGTVLLDITKYHQASSLLPQTFSLSGHSVLWEAIQDMYVAGQPIDYITIQQKLGAKGVARIGGISYLSSLMDGLPDRGSIEPHVKIVRDCAYRRWLFDRFDEAKTMLEDGTIDIGEALAITEDACLRVRADAGVKHSYHIRDVVPEVLREFEEIRAHSGLIGKTTGITKLDAMTTGIRPDEYWIVGARPSRGKTVLGVQIATANAMQNVPTLFFSFEMTRRQIVRRMLPFFSDIEAWKIRDPRNASVTDMRYIHETSQRLTEMPLWVVDPDGMKASDVLAAAHFHIHRYGIKLIVVDYLQIIRGPQRDIRERVTHCSNMLRSIPKMHGVSLVATSQLRRLEDENSRPSMSDLKESGDIEAHAHTVLLIHRPIKDRRWTGEDELVVAKQREGLVGTAKVWLSDAKLWFVERET